VADHRTFRADARPLLAGGAPGIITRNRNPANSPLLSLQLVRRGEESGMVRDPLGRAPELRHVLVQTSNQQGRGSRPLFTEFVMRDDVILGFFESAPAYRTRWAYAPCLYGSPSVWVSKMLSSFRLALVLPR
jgi:hypothetical protein